MQLTDEDIKKLQEKYGKGNLLHITLEAEGKAGQVDHKPAEDLVFKKPDMNTLSASAALESSNPVGSSQVIFNDCLVFGDRDIANDPDRFISVSKHLPKLVKERKVKLGKL